VKNQNREDCVYGKVFVDRKAMEWENNLLGKLSDQAAAKLAKCNFSNGTTAKLFYSGKLSPTKVREWLADGGVPASVKATKVGDEIAMLPPAHIHARARRYAVKLFLSHWHAEAYRHHFGTEPPFPYAVAFLGHAHVIRAKLRERTRLGERAMTVERTAVSERAIVRARTTLLERAIMTARTIDDERAMLRESTSPRERAIVRARTTLLERAMSRERTMLGERAMMIERTKNPERATPIERTKLAERAKYAERTNGVERATLSERTIAGERPNDKPIT
jgi:hypothetical protein